MDTENTNLSLEGIFLVGSRTMEFLHGDQSTLHLAQVNFPELSLSDFFQKVELARFDLGQDCGVDFSILAVFVNWG